MNKIRTILMGTSEFASEIFRHLDLNIVSVITAPDKPKGRKNLLTPSPVKIWAKNANLSVLEPIKIRDNEWIDKIKELNPDLIILCAYGQIIPKEILDIPKYKALNIHPSLLPKYRGASPIHTAILNNDKETGVTLMLMDEQMDHGDIVAQKKIQISNINYKELENKLIDLSVKLLKKLPDYINGKIKPQPQDHEKAVFCKLIEKEDGKIDWDNTAEEIERKIRAYHIWPTVYTDKFKILQAEVLNESRNKKISEVFTENKELMVQTKKGILILKQVQPQGKKPMSGKDYLNGHPDVVNSVLK